MIQKREARRNSTLGSSINRMASINISREKSSTGMGAGPTPLAYTCSPQKVWSPKKGIMVVGHCSIGKAGNAHKLKGQLASPERHI